MAMQVKRNYDHSRSDCAERVKEKQAAWTAEKAKEAEKAAEGKKSGRLAEPQDEYISSEKSGEKPAGRMTVPGKAKMEKSRRQAGASRESRRRNVSQIRIKLTGKSRS